MPLMPKRVKYRKTQRGSRKGTASRNLKIDFGEFGLQTLEQISDLSSTGNAHGQGQRPARVLGRDGATW